MPTSCEAFQSLSLSRLEFFKTLQNTPKGSGCGPSRWKYEHLKALVSRSTTAEGLFSVCDLIAQGKIPPAIHEVISSSRLIASPKENGDVRPITIGECLRRLTAKVICIQKKESFNSHFQPIQHGVAVKGGTELLIHHVSLLLESNPDWVLLKTDIKNAFNSLERASLMPQVAKSFPDVYQLVFQVYSRCNPLISCHGEQPHVLSSQEGVHQGDPLGPMLFSAAIHPLLVDLQESHPTTRFLAYLNDFFLLGPIQYVSSAFDELKCSLPQIGLSIATKKCELFTNGHHCEDIPDEVRVSVLGTTILGTPIGQPRYVEAACSEFAKGGEDLCNQLLALEDTQSSMLLLRYCHIPRINHLGRTVAPSLMKSATRIHDSLSQSSFKHLIKCPDLENDQ